MLTPGGPRGLVIAIDGPAGAGKSTLARRLAGLLGLPYVNTGSMYRALAYEALRLGVDVEEGPALAELTRRLRFGLVRPGPVPELEVEGIPAGSLALPEVEAVVSQVARHPEVRELMRAEQRRLGAGGAVMEGRDIGTVVFPEAEVKIFLAGAPDERAARRRRERSHDGSAGALHERDALDATVNPFVPAADAVEIDTTRLTPDEVLERALAIVRERLGGAP